MAGRFELVEASDGSYRVLLIDADGALMAVSVEFDTKTEAVQGIERAREIAGTAFITDLTRSRAVAPPHSRRQVLAAAGGRT
ncbi:YegP family protein [Arthrobacter sp. 35W]|uniref:YegP family protein n=1 Tax=Arthrobacter sp. 35W TaxID=1132441 RepID=UPI00055971AA|nr:DUF1508 domain-containing protein [Arthrobacter sp. 35W]